jgi:hypothetical protein
VTTRNGKLTAAQQKLRDAMVTAIKEGRWQVVDVRYGLTIRWSSPEKTVPPQMLDNAGQIGGWPGTTRISRTCSCRRHHDRFWVPRQRRGLAGVTATSRTPWLWRSWTIQRGL